MPAQPSIVVVGSSNADLILRLTRLPRPGETITGGTFSTASGGKGANQALAAARAGAAVILVARVGDDAFGGQSLQGLRDAGVDLRRVARDSGPSGVALILVGADGENCIGVAPGANARLSPADVAQAADAITSADALLLQLEAPLETVRAAATLARDAGVRILLDPAPARDLDDELLSLISILTPNQTEAEQLTGIAVTDEASAARAAGVLRGRGVAIAIVTLGGQGSLVSTSEGDATVPAFAVEAADTTAAGDAFNGALAVALAEGQQLLAAVRFASAAAALSVTRVGAQPSMPPRERIEALLG